MTYNETLDYLYNATPAFEKVGAGAYKEGLSNTHALDVHFGHPHLTFPTIHVAGTNGKGSVSHTLAAFLQSAGMKVGLYTSPHLVDFAERIKINGVSIPHEYVIKFVEEEKSFFEPLQPSFFELTTALAFKYFAEEKIDVAVIEVGLGGRLDCTNIINPVLSVITNISFDHTGFLGNTLQLIAKEKAGIIKHATPVVIGEYTDETGPVFKAVASEMQAPITFAQDNPEIISETYDFDSSRTYTTRSYGEIKGQLMGSYQLQNTNTALTAMKKLTDIFKIKDAEKCAANAVAHVCDLTHLNGRWQTLQHNPLVVCDTGHNLAGWKYLAPQITKQWETLKAEKPNSMLRIVFGMVDDKDIKAVMQLLPKNATYYFTEADTHRAISADKVKDIAQAHGLQGVIVQDVKQAYERAYADSSPEDFIFVGGSSYVVADFLASNC